MKIPKPLIDDIASGKCLPFIGAGFSLNAKLSDNSVMPDWPALTSILAEIADIPPNQNGPQVANEFEIKFGRVQLIEAIRHALHSDIAEPGNAHSAFAQLPFETVYTTNFDLLLEEANSIIKKPFRSLVGELQMPFHGGPLTTNIVKMHGDLRHEEHIIVTQEDYDNYLDKYPVISTHLSAMLITRTALFIGYSLADPDFQHIRKVIRSRLGRFERMSYIIQFNQKQSTIKSMLSDNLHLINLSTQKYQKKDEKLEEFFLSIQEELDIRAGNRLRQSKPGLFEPLSKDTFEESSRSVDSNALLMSSSNLCFVLMPFGREFDDIYREFIKPKILEVGLEPLRADEIFSPGSIMEQIRSAIQQSRFCVADLTGRNPNVLFELGIAQTLGKPTVLLTQDISDVPFDVAQYRTIVYNRKELQKTSAILYKALQNALGYDRLNEARELIASGMIRAAVALIGVLFEQSLRQLIIKSDIVDTKGGERFLGKQTIGKMLQVLSDSNIIEIQDKKKLMEYISIRNQAVHELKEPKKEKALIFLDIVENFIKIYIPNS